MSATTQTCVLASWRDEVRILAGPNLIGMHSMMHIRNRGLVIPAPQGWSPLMDFSFFLLEALLDQRTSNCFWYISSSNNESGNLPNRSLFITTHWSLQVCRIRNERSRLERLVGLNDCSELYQKSSFWWNDVRTCSQLDQEPTLGSRGASHYRSLHCRWVRTNCSIPRGSHAYPAKCRRLYFGIFAE